MFVRKINAAIALPTSNTHAVPLVSELAADGPDHRGDMLQLLACVVQGGDHSSADAKAVGGACREPSEVGEAAAATGGTLVPSGHKLADSSGG